MSITGLIKEQKDKFFKQRTSNQRNAILKENLKLEAEKRDKERLAKLADQNTILKQRIAKADASIEKARPNKLRALGKGLAKVVNRQQGQGNDITERRGLEFGGGGGSPFNQQSSKPGGGPFGGGSSLFSSVGEKPMQEREKKKKRAIIINY